MTPRFLLRLEGLALGGGAIAAYYLLDGPVWLFVVLALAPDVGMLGYLVGSRFGSRLYNSLHTYSVPAVLGGTGVLVGPELLTFVALVWTAHIGLDRAAGYGLKYPTDFHDTHLGRVGRVVGDVNGPVTDSTTDPTAGRTD